MSIQFVNRRHGWVEVSEGGNGTLEGELFATADGGRTWSLQSASGPVDMGGKGWLPFAEGFSFRNAEDGWMGGGQRAAGQFGGPGFLWLFRSVDGGASWTHVSLPVPRGWSQAVTYVSEPQWFGRTGYLFVSYGVLGGSRQTTVLYATEDGGARWAVRPVPAGLGAVGTLVDYVDSRTGFGLASGHLLRTDDGGAHWREVAVNPHWKWSSVEFVNSRDGWIAWRQYNQNGTYWERTNDGGRTWTVYTPVLREP